jgi:hypothetical protein
MSRAGLSLVCLLLVGTTAHACSVPVFRYALERWSPASYDVIVFHRGPLNPAQEDAVQGLRASGQSANVRIVEADVEGRLEPNVQAVWAREGKRMTLPRVVVRYPETDPEVPSLWSGPLESDTIAAWLDSPARQKLFQQLTGGHAGVILLVLSGDVKSDEAARAMLRREVPRIAARIELPAPTADGPQVQSAIPVRVEFPVVEVARGPAEEPLVRMLLASEDGLDRVRGPIAFPVFGRGRALCSLHGDALVKPGELRQALEFLCRACSCQVKELNPGVDLLVTGNWDAIFDAEPGPQPREAPATPRAAEQHPAATTGPPRAEVRSAPPAGYDAAHREDQAASHSGWLSWRRPATIAAVVLVVLTGIWALRARRLTSDHT